MPLSVNNEQRERLVKALLGAYLTPVDFANAIWIKTGFNLGDEMSLAGGKRSVVSAAVQLADGQGWLEQLVRAAASGAPLSVPLKDLSVELGLVPLPSAPVHTPPLVTPGDGALQEVIRKRRPPILMQLFSERLQVISRTVCWIGLKDPLQNNPQLGSGFLVGPNLLLTNFHVVRRLINKELERGAVICRFDHLSGSASGASAGLGEDWCIDHASWASSDEFVGGGAPTADDLDYALVRLNSDVGSGLVHGAERGWLRIAADPPPVLKDDLLFVVQHPARVEQQEGAQRIAFGVVMGFEHDDRRIRYDTGTTPGSSGSPAFTVDLQPTALHQGSEPLIDTSRRPVASQRTYNQGIPLRLIIRRLRERQIPKFWEDSANA